VKFLFASDSFKGSLTSKEICEILTSAAGTFFPDAEVIGISVADGGEGTVDALIEATDGEKIYVDVHNPLMRKIPAYYGKLDDESAVIEMASASGLTLIDEEERNPLYTTTFGTGEMILDAVNNGFRKLFIAIGGSATNDGGMGCAGALGIRFLDNEGKELDGIGSNLEKVCEIDISGLDSRLKDTEITVMCDVTNPLCGENGATRTFAKQKGATEEIIERLEKGMCNYRDVIRRQFNVDPDQIPGGGAAGGLGTMLMTFLNGNMKSGIETVLDLVNFDSLLKDTDFVITGEGRCDWQSCFGKVVCGVGERAKRAGIPAIVICGSIGPGAEGLYEHGITSITATSEEGMPLEEAMARARELYHEKAVRLLKTILSR
jgi:glycerate kinase